MKELLNNLLQFKFTKPIAFVLGLGLLLEFVIFPGLTASNTIANLASLALLLGILAYGLNWLIKKF